METMIQSEQLGITPCTDELMCRFDDVAQNGELHC
jgi:hypothetical protein